MPFFDDRIPSSDLAALAARWRTERQLSRLALRPDVGLVRFAVLGDVEPSRFWLFRRLFNRDGVFFRQMEAIRSAGPAFVIQLGDMVELGRSSRYRRFLKELGRADPGRPYLTVLGNHDRARPHGPAHSALYRRLFGRANYVFDRAGIRFVVLDSSAKRLTAAQRRWLRKVLDRPGRKIIFTHMPPAHLGLWGGIGAAHEIGGFTRGAREFSEIAAAAHVDRVYMGHVHAFGVQDHLGVRYVLTGGGGSALFPSGAADRFHHFLTVEAGPRGIRERVHALDGDSFEIPSAPVLLPLHDHPHPWRRWLGGILRRARDFRWAEA